MAHASAIDVVVAHSLDRLSRNQVHLGVLVSEFDDCRVRIEFATEVFDDTAIGRFIRQARAFSAEMEREQHIERVRRGIHARVRAGLPLRGPTDIYGYRWDSEAKRYATNPATAPIVERIFSDYLAGHALQRIARDLSAEGTPSPRGLADWNPTSVRSILKNRAYTGRLVGLRYERNGRAPLRIRPADEWVKFPDGVIPALISDADFTEVQQRLGTGRQRSPGRLQDPDRFLLRGGIARCGICGHALALQRPAGRSYYQCSNGRPGAGCPRPGLSTVVLDAAAWEVVERLLTKREVVAAELTRLQQDDPTQRDLAPIEQRLAELRKQQENLIAYVGEHGSAVADLVNARLASLGEQRNRLELEHEAVLARQQAWHRAWQHLESLEAWCRQVASRVATLTLSERRLAVEALGISVKVFPANHEPRYVITAAMPLPVENS